MMPLKHFNRPAVKQVKINDDFWSPYIGKIYHTTLPYSFSRFEADGYLNNFALVAGKGTGESKGPQFADGLLFEMIRGASDLLAGEYDQTLDSELDRMISVIVEAAETSPDGFLCTPTMLRYPDKRFGENGGNLIYQHDVYDQGALVEAAISHYLATEKTALLKVAVKAANYMAGEVIEKHIIPGHSLPEEEFVKLYCLFRDHRELDSLASELGVEPEKYLKTAEFWYDGRGRKSCGDHFSFYYNQNHLPFSHQTTAEGHSVRAALCYTGACAVAREAGRTDYLAPLRSIWDNIASRKLHISGGIGTRHDIEGFDLDYNLPNDAYLETCAAIGLAFFAGEYSLIEPSADKFDVFELALCNNILDAISEDGTHFFYQNPLISNGGIKRWDWHVCPCCPPMLAKLYGSLGTYIYMYDEDEIYVNLPIDSEVKTGGFELTMKNSAIKLVRSAKPMTLKVRIPWYAKNFALTRDGNVLELRIENGYAVIENLTSGDELGISYDCAPRRICANTKVADDRGMVCIMNGQWLMCAEAIDNGGEVDYELAKDAKLTLDGECVIAECADGGKLRLIPYYKWTSREGSGKMRVWFRQAEMKPTDAIERAMGDRLYFDYDEIATR